MQPHNCFICGKEFEELVDSKLASMSSKYRICEGCLLHSNPEEDFKQVKEVVAAYSFTSFDDITI